jgi:nickel-dependent lactate racemase
MAVFPLIRAYSWVNKMKEMVLQSADPQGINRSTIKKMLYEAIADDINSLRKVLLIPPDITRMHSGAGMITAIYYDFLKDSCHVDILPALGTHDPMTDEEIDAFFGRDIPKDRFIVHNWRSDVVKVGEIPGEFVAEVSEGLIDTPISVELNKRLLDNTYDRIISIGQVVPHEVVGMANYNKNLLVGCGGTDIINQSHMLGAVYGMERIMGKDHSPVRKVFDYAEKNFLMHIPLTYVLTVTTENSGEVTIHGLYIGRSRVLFEKAVALSQQKNLAFVEEPIKKIVVYLDEDEFKSTWLGNKSIYRTRMAIADGGDLIILAPGIVKFGEDTENDRCIRKYGYVGREKILNRLQDNPDLQKNKSVAAHLIHGSSDGRFNIIYAVKKLAQSEVENVGYAYMDYDEAIAQYDPKKLKNGFNTLENGEVVFYISNPALGLWACKENF